MDRLSLILIVALFATALGLHHGPSPVTQILSHGTLRKLLKQSSVHVANTSPVCDGTVDGMYTSLGTTVSYSGSFRGSEVPGGIKSDYDVVFRGKYSMMGWEGEFNGDARGKYSTMQVGNTTVVRITGKSTFRFQGSFNGVPANFNGVSTFSVDADSTGKLTATETGTFSTVIADKMAKGTFTGKVNNDSFSSSMQGMYAGKKFSFEFQGHIEDLLSLLAIENEGKYELTCNGETSTGTYKE